MIIPEGARILACHRRLFEKDEPRFFVGEVLASNDAVIKVQRFLVQPRPEHGAYRGQERAAHEDYPSDCRDISAVPASGQGSGRATAFRSGQGTAGTRRRDWFSHGPHRARPVTAILTTAFSCTVGTPGGGRLIFVWGSRRTPIAKASADMESSCPIEPASVIGVNTPIESRDSRSQLRQRESINIGGVRWVVAVGAAVKSPGGVSLHSNSAAI